jgi:hypothetical protein
MTVTLIPATSDTRLVSVIRLDSLILSVCLALPELPKTGKKGVERLPFFMQVV